jgi:hypothetical protein
VNGTLIGGSDSLAEKLQDGSFDALLASRQQQALPPPLTAAVAAAQVRAVGWRLFSLGWGASHLTLNT